MPVCKTGRYLVKDWPYTPKFVISVVGYFGNHILDSLRSYGMLSGLEYRQ